MWRLQTLEARPVPSSPDLTDISRRLAALEQRPLGTTSQPIGHVRVVPSRVDLTDIQNRLSVLEAANANLKVELFKDLDKINLIPLIMHRLEVLEIAQASKPVPEAVPPVHKAVDLTESGKTEENSSPSVLMAYVLGKVVILETQINKLVEDDKVIEDDEWEAPEVERALRTAGLTHSWAVLLRAGQNIYERLKADGLVEFSLVASKIRARKFKYKMFGDAKLDSKIICRRIIEEYRCS